MTNPEDIEEALERYKRDPQKLIPILQAVQAKSQFLSKEAMRYVARELKLPESRVFGVASFYSHFALAPKGKHIVRLCDGTACHVRGAEAVKSALRETIGLKDGENTSGDGLFTLEVVACLGACGLGPVMVVDGEVRSQMTPQKAKDAIVEIKNAKSA